jgi:PAS domain S-box-containing protein
VEQAHDMIVVVQDGIMKFCNRKVAEMWGGEVEEIVGQPYDIFIDPDELPRVRENYLRRMAGEEAPQLYGTLLVRRDGSRVHADLGAGTIIFEGRPADLIVLRDITEKKEAEKQLKEAHELQQAILNASPVGIGVTTGRTLTWANHAMDLMMGYERNELKGQPSRVLFQDDGEYERALQELLKGVKTQGVGTVETVWKRKDGALLNISLSIAPVRPDSPEVVAIAHDTTARKRIEDELRRTSALQETILRASPAGIGLAINRIHTWGNEAMYRMVGYEPRELEDAPTRIVYANEEEYDRASREISQGLERHGSASVETLWRRKDGSLLNVHLQAASIRPGSPEVIAVVLDITSRKKAEEELRKTQALQEAILNASPVGIGYAMKDVINWENDAMSRLLGYEHGELKGQTARVLFVNDGEFEQTYQTLVQGIRKEGFGEVETVWKRKDGSAVDVHLLIAAIRPGEPEVIVMVTDITARKKVTKELDQTRALQEAILRASPVGIGLVSGRDLVWENPAMCSILGVEEGTLKGQPLPTVFTDYTEYERASREIDDGIRQRGSGEVETVWKRRDGSKVEVALRVAPIHPGAPECIGVATDITSRKQAEKALHDSEDLFRTMVDISPLPLSLIDATGKYLHVNPAFTRLFGYTLEDIPDGKTWFAQAFPDDEQRETAVRLWTADAADHPVGEVRPRTFRVRCRDGSFKEILFLPAATPSGLQVVVYQDITGQKIYARLRESEDLYRHLVEDLNIGIYRSSGDPEGRFIWGNTGLLSILGFEDLADLRGVPVKDLFQKPGGRKALLRELQEKKFVKNRLLSLKKKDGTPVKVSVTALADFDMEGKLRFITGLVQEAGEKGGAPPKAASPGGQ